jgi:hypothetical protein
MRRLEEMETALLFGRGDAAALPDRRLHAKQWHTDIRTGSPEQVADSCSQEHFAIRSIIGHPFGLTLAALLRGQTDRF